MAREDVEEYLAIIRGEYRLESAVDIPENFVSLDVDGDGYFSFDELILAIDKYFDIQLDMNVEELRELNEFFFAQ
jgi:Ca2+-binding EF-hand superfamily protein